MANERQFLFIVPVLLLILCVWLLIQHFQTLSAIRFAGAGVVGLVFFGVGVLGVYVEMNRLPTHYPSPRLRGWFIRKCAQVAAMSVAAAALLWGLLHLITFVFGQHLGLPNEAVSILYVIAAVWMFTGIVKLMEYFTQ